jgi:uncharacterized membrane protein
MNARHRSALAASCAIILAVPGSAQTPAMQTPAAQTVTADYAVARRIIAARCKICHSAIPQEDGLNTASQPPKGVKFDTPADIHLYAPRIIEQAVTLKRMPPDNATHMKDEERSLLGKWFEAGAPVP